MSRARGGDAARWRLQPDRRGCVAIATVLACACVLGVRDVAALTTADGCTDLDGVPIQYVIDYQSAIQSIFNGNCISCHSGDQPPAGLDLSAGGSWSHLVDVPSSQDPSFTRVIPDQPYQSLLFLKVNCDTPGVGHRMPFGQDPLSDDDQAVILDWIAGGAPPGQTDGVFRSGFDAR